MKVDRIAPIINILLENKDYVSVDEIAKNLNVSKRTIYSDLNSNKLVSHLHGAKIIKTPNKGVRLETNEEQEKQIRFELNVKNDEVVTDIKNDDVTKLLILLLTNRTPITSETVSRYLYKSLNSIMSLVDQTNEEIKNFNCYIDRKQNYGMWLIGNEKNIQKMFKKKCDLINIVDSVFDKNILDTVYQVCTHSEILLNAKFTDFDFKNLICNMCILIQRVINGHHFEDNSKANSSMQEFYIAENMKIEIEYNLHIKLSHGDQCAISNFLLKTRKTDNIVINDNFDEKVVDIFVEKISNKLNCNLSNDSELKINLLKHLKPAIRRLRFGVPCENPLLDHIRYDYSYVYIAVMMTIDEIETFEDIFFDNNELSYICLHIIAALNRRKNQKSTEVLLVNNEGLSVQTFLKTMLESNFIELSITVCDSYSIPDKKFDIVLNSTNQDIPLESIHISSTLNNDDLDSIRHWLFSFELNKLMKIKNKIKDYIFLFHDQTTNKEELIKKYSNFLLETGYVSKNFYESVLEREKHSSTSIGRGVAVPHGNKEFVNKSVIIIIFLDNPIVWDDLMVDTVFLTAIQPTETLEFSHLFKALFNIVSDEEELKLLKQSKNIDEVKELLIPKNVSKEVN